MGTAQQFIDMSPWWASATGRHLLDWEREWFAFSVADVFGFHALQLGLCPMKALEANRMPHRWLACAGERSSAGAAASMPPETRDSGEREAMRCEFDALPFPSQSLDLVVMPHTLELARDPHLTLREVERVLVPEGRLMITGFNPARWWTLPGTAHRVKPQGTGPELVFDWPLRDDMIGFRRLRDWLRLLGFEVESARFGRFGPQIDNRLWQRRLAWLEPVGQRWWPVFGALYGVTAVKRVRGLRLVGLAKRQARYAQAARPALVGSQQGAQRSGRQGSED